MKVEVLLEELKAQKVRLALKGDKLLCQLPESGISDALFQQLKDHKEALIKILQQRANFKEYRSIPVAPPMDTYALSPSQLRFWLIYKIRGKSKEFNIYNTISLPDELDLPAFEAAFYELLKRHEILRTEFVEIAGTPQQRILAPRPVPILRFTSLAEAEPQVFDYAFDLNTFPLFKIAIVALPTGNKLLFNIHHSISDGWSMDIIARDLMGIYHAKLAKQASKLPPLTVQYKDYAQWQNKMLQTAVLNPSRAYWQKQLSGQLPYLQLPSDYMVTIQSQEPAASYSVYLSAEQKQKIEGLSNANGISTFAIFSAALKILLYRLTGEKDLLLGIPAANRNHNQLRDMVGCFINTLILRNTIDEKQTFQSWLEQLSATLGEALAHQNYPFEQLLNLLKIPQKDNRFPISPVFLNMLDFEGSANSQIESFNPHHGNLEHPPKFDVECYIKSYSNGFLLYWVYDQTRFKPETIEYWVDNYLGIIDQVVTNPSMSLEAVKSFETYLPAAEDKMPSNDFEYFEASVLQQSIVHRFEQQVLRFPKRVAVHFNGKELTYEALNQAANALAHQITAQASPGTQRVGLLLKHSEQCVIGMLGTLKAGYAYVPIECNTPLSRIEYILEDSNSDLVIYSPESQKTLESLQKRHPDLKTILLNSDGEKEAFFPNPTRSIEPQQEAYVIYTSGSTGQPKGVVQNHRNILHYIRIYTNNVQISKDDNLSLFASYSFDASVKDIYAAILNGGKVSIYDLAESGLHNLSSWLLQQGISIIHMVPTIYRHFMKTLAPDEVLTTVRLIDLGGEACYKADFDYFKKHFPEHAFLVNDYGPTEATIVSQKFFHHTSSAFRSNLSLGKPVTETNIYLLDENNQKKGVYEEGEIAFESDYLSLGYLNRKELTEKVFLIDQFGAQKRIYKSGDIGMRLPNGEIEFLHRKDSQVKFNGLRIELSEIEYQLMQLATVEEAVVALKKLNGNSYLTAYLRATEDLPLEKIKIALKEQLPEYMIPAIYIFLETFPRTRTGKIDRKGFPDPMASDLRTKDFVAPQGHTEQELAVIWEALLPVSKIGAQDNFFELGGHSLIAIQMTQKIHQVFEAKIEITDVFSNPTIESLARFIEQQDRESYRAIPVLKPQDDYALSHAQLRIWVASKFDGGSSAYTISNAFVLEGSIEATALEKAFYTVIARNESLRTVFIEIDGQVRQKILPVTAVNFELQKNDFSKAQLTPLEEEIKIKHFIEQEKQKTFDLTSGPLLNATLIKTGRGKNILLVNIHHIIIDGWSLNIFFQQLIQSYQNQLLGVEEQVVVAPVEYKDYAAWHLNTFEIKRKFWEKLYADGVPESKLPTDFSRGKMMNFSSATLKKMLDQMLLQDLKQRASTWGLTLNNLIFSLYSLLIAKLSGQEKVVIGTLVSGRSHLETEQLLGVFINFLPIKLRAEASLSLQAYVHQSNELLLQAYKNQDYPFDLMVEHLLTKRDLSRNPFFDTLINFHSENQVSGGVDDKDMAQMGLMVQDDQAGLNDQTTSGLDIKLELSPQSEDRLEMAISYNTQLYKKETIERLFQKLLDLFQVLLTQPEMKVKDCLPELNSTTDSSPNSKKLPVNLCGTFVLEPMEDILSYWSDEFEMNLDLHFAPYHQVFQQLLNPESLLHGEGINVLFVRIDDFLRSAQNRSEVEKINFLESISNDLMVHFQQSRRFAFVPYIICMVPPSTEAYSESPDLLKTIVTINQKLEDFFRNSIACYLIDVEEAMSLYEVEEAFDQKTNEVGHMPFSSDGYAAIATFLARKIRAWKDDPYKVIAVDCDNTLWGGICGEDGAANVILDKHFQAVQQFLVNKQREGFLLVLCSKNNEEDAWEVFNTRTEMILQASDIIDFRINWNYKSDNIRDLAKELNVGVNSFIFLDDSDLEIEQMMMACPEVLSLQMPEDPADFEAFLKNNWAFDKLHVTEEDTRRNKMYKAEKKRKIEKAQATEHTRDFLASLNIKVQLNELVDKDIERAVQLTQRTNQFNLNGIRRNTGEVIKLMQADHTLNWTVRVEDKFGEYGLVGVLLAEKVDQTLRINTFLLSCRVLGRNVEHEIIAAIEAYRQENGLESVVLDFVETAKNKPFAQFLDTCLEKKEYQLSQKAYA